MLGVFRVWQKRVQRVPGSDCRPGVRIGWRVGSWHSLVNHSCCVQRSFVSCGIDSKWKLKMHGGSSLEFALGTDAIMWVPGDIFLRVVES